MQVVLVMFRPDGQHRSFSIIRDVTVFGRREDSDFRIPLSDISRKHCRLVRDTENDSLRIEDLGSSNGTFVNGNRVSDAEVHAGDTIGVGPVTFVLQVNGLPAEDEMQPIMSAGGAATAPAATAAVAEDEAAELTADQLESTDDDEIARIMNADNTGSSIGGAFPVAENSGSLGDHLLDADSEDPQSK